MISFNEKKIIIDNFSSPLSLEIAMQLSILGAKIVLLGKEELILKENISILEGKGHQYILKKDNDDLISKFLAYHGEKFDGYIYISDSYEELYKNYQCYDYFEKMITNLAKEEYSNENLSALYVSEKEYLNTHVLKLLSTKLIDRKFRINSIIADSTKESFSKKDVSNIAMFLMSESTQYIVGEVLNIDSSN